ncbi:EamA family transporter [Kaistella sp. DKR-2]|uniref:DMT family transporter n=1 Tax=Kaistella soli TaxID=2849654 RepID=UPI001C25C2E6|nr:EamA family transporter [Kaistella soli]MBU8881512.1 EamA family transporter [Kaistella soli]
MFRDPRLVLAIFTVAVVWGTTFLGIRIAVESIPPWFVAGIRQFIAAALLLIILLFSKELKWIGWKNLWIQIMFSILMLIVANGMMTVAEKHISSSLASLISAASPLLIFLGSIFFGLQKFTYRALAGIIMGFTGIVLIFKDGLEDLLNPDYRMGVLFSFIAISGWALGSIFTKKLHLQKQNISLNLFYQFAFSAVIQIGFGFMLSDRIDVASWTFRSMAATVYLAVFGSVAAYFAFHFALKKISPTQISLLSYVNTIIAIFLGWLVLNEEISAAFITATVLIICGVFITNYQKGMFRRK